MVPAVQAASTNINDRQTVLVMAHPDDEILWASQIIPYVKAIVIAGPAVSYTKRDAINRIFATDGPFGYKPVSFVFPPVPDSQHAADAANACYRDLAKYTYDKTYAALRPILETLKFKGMTRVLTHNPWGEYGHPNHRNVSAIVRNMGASDLRFDVWHDAVVHTKVTATLEQGVQYLDAQFLTGVTYSPNYSWPTTKFFNAKKQYQNYGVWTWHDGVNEYPTGYRKFWRVVVDGKNLLNTNPTLLSQIQKIRTDIPYEAFDGNRKSYTAPPYYTCANAQSKPVFYSGGLTTMSQSSGSMSASSQIPIE